MNRTGHALAMLAVIAGAVIIAIGARTIRVEAKDPPTQKGTALCYSGRPPAWA